MLPVVAGPDATRLQILLYTIVLVAVAVAPWPLGYFDAVYGVDLAGARRRHAVARGRGLPPPRGQRRRCAPRAGCSRFSILYLFALFATLLLEVVVARRAAPLIG